MSKWTDKAALTLEKREVKDTILGNGQERQVHLNAVGNTVGEHDQCVLRETVVYSPPSTKKEVAKSEVGVVQEVDAQVIKDTRVAEMSSSEDEKTDGTPPITKVVCQVHEAAVVVAETDHTESDE